jgi:hypothetical protein
MNYRGFNEDREVFTKYLKDAKSAMHQVSEKADEEFLSKEDMAKIADVQETLNDLYKKLSGKK